MPPPAITLLAVHASMTCRFRPETCMKSIWICKLTVATIRMLLTLAYGQRVTVMLLSVCLSVMPDFAV